MSASGGGVCKPIMDVPEVLRLAAAGCARDEGNRSLLFQAEVCLKLLDFCTRHYAVGFLCQM